MKKIFLLFLVQLSLLNLHSQMQPGAVTQNLVDVSTNSPEVASLGKFGNIPVSYATGVPSITIPIYDINIAGIKLPISLDYHGGGVKVGETSSSVGIGWALNGIGLVSRQIVGLPDEEPDYGLIDSPDLDSVAHAPNYFYQYLFNVQRGLADNEPDIFSYTLNGESGSFSFRRGGAIMQVPVTANKIVYNAGNITITDPNGILYIFGLPVNSMINTPTVNNLAPVSWRLTKMVARNSLDTIYFNYETSCNASYQKIETFSHYLGYTVSCDYTNSGPTFQNTPQNHYSTQTNYDAYPKEINWRGGKIVFTNSCDRQDVSGSGMRLNEALVYSGLNNSYKLIKRVKLFQSYFFSTGIEYAFTKDTSSAKKRRLRLDSVAIMPVTGTDKPQVYSMTYDTTRMAPRETEAQDRWGYNNGKFSNFTLVPQANVLYNGQYYSIGGANRNSDSSYMLACSIKSITYPTKGKSVFEFVPKFYYSNEKQTTDYSTQVYCGGGVRSTDTSYFTPTVNDTSFKFSYNLSAIANASPAPSNYPDISIWDMTSNTSFAFKSVVGNVATGISGNNEDLNVIAGHTYRLVCNTYTTSSAVSGIATVNWTRDMGDSIVRKIGGGIMVKSITNYDYNGRFLNRDKYEYEGDRMLTDIYYQNINVETVIPRGGQGQFCTYIEDGLPPGYSYIFHGNSVLPVSESGGSPVLYGKVTKYEVDSLGNDNGKTVYTYNVFNDYPGVDNFANIYGPIISYVNRGFYLISETWKNNFLSGVTEYKRLATGYQPVRATIYNYKPYRDNNEIRLKIKNKYLTACCQDQNMNGDYALHDFVLDLIPQPTGAMLLESQTDTTYDDSGNKLYSRIEFEYNDTSHTFPTLKRSYTSTGDKITQQSSYPRDLAASGNIYQKMVDRNIVAHVIKQITSRNGMQLNLEQVNYYDWNNNSKLLLPQTQYQQVINYSVDTMLRFNKYDIYGNILEQQKDSDIKISYLWGYDTLYPIATVYNAAQTDIAYTSFEIDATGNWNISSPVRDSTQSVTGKLAYSLSNGSISKSGLSSSKSYIVSYWSKSGSAIISGTTPVLIMSKGGWNCYEHRVSGGVTSVTVSGGVTIDELRLFPVDAKMNTFCYEPLVGLTHVSDENNRISYYEYDGFQRLILVRDMDKNIIKTYDYRFKL